MKKITLFAVAAVALSLASCTKDYTCTCVSTPASGSVVTTTTKIYKATEGEAREKCLGGQTTQESGGVSITGSNVTCDLK